MMTAAAIRIARTAAAPATTGPRWTSVLPHGNETVQSELSIPIAYRARRSSAATKKRPLGRGTEGSQDLFDFARKGASSLGCHNSADPLGDHCCGVPNSFD